MTGSQVTIFGGSGFLGRYVVDRFARAGHPIRVAVRRPHAALFLKPLGDVGQIDILRTDVRNDASVAAAVARSGIVVNLVGILAERGRQRFDAIHAEAAGRIAAAARHAGTERLVHVSAIGADPHSDSAYGLSKAEGERRIRESFPEATILRPSVVFGPEDDFTNRFARLLRLLPVMPLVCGDSLFQPVYVGDVADAVLAAAKRVDAAGRIYELGGPQQIAFRDLLMTIMHEIGVQRPLLPVPLSLVRLGAALLGLLPNPPITSDQLRLLMKDNVVGEGAATLADLGIAPTPMASVLSDYLMVWRRGGQFAAA
ncbi:MAG: complex I NDUFA9 subunit family protein [Rhodothalassiaceae bacterium]